MDLIEEDVSSECSDLENEGDWCDHCELFHELKWCHYCKTSDHDDDKCFDPYNYYG